MLGPQPALLKAAEGCWYILNYTFSFDAAHSLPQMPTDHQCHRLHGHTWKVTVTVGTEKLKAYMVVDFAVLKGLLMEVMATFDHHLVNDTLHYPTCESLARCIYDWLRGQLDEQVRTEAPQSFTQALELIAVHVEETPGHGCSYGQRT